VFFLEYAPEHWTEKSIRVFFNQTSQCIVVYQSLLKLETISEVND